MATEDPENDPGGEVPREEIPNGAAVVHKAKTDTILGIKMGPLTGGVGESPSLKIRIWEEMAGNLRTLGIGDVEAVSHRPRSDAV